MKKATPILLLICFFLLLSGAGCINIKTVSEGSVFKTTDGAQSWKQQVDLLSIEGIQKLNDVNVTTLVFDQQDYQTIYLGTEKSGLYVSHDGAESWLKIENLPEQEKITALAPHPRIKNVLYAALGTKLFKSIDCGYSWEQIHLETNPITFLAVDSLSTSHIYAGLEDGRLIHSLNGGQTWSKLMDFHVPVRQIVVHPQNNSLIYLSTEGDDFYKSEDKGENWHNLKEELKDYPGASKVIKMIINPRNPQIIITLSPYGLLRSDNRGATWMEYSLLTPREKTTFRSFATGGENLDTLYYITDSALYKSINGGIDWLTKDLPSQQAVRELLINPEDTAVLYLGLSRE